MSTYRLKIVLKDTDPIRWYKVEVPGDMTENRLRMVLRVVSGRKAGMEEDGRTLQTPTRTVAQIFDSTEETEITEETGCLLQLDEKIDEIDFDEPMLIKVSQSVSRADGYAREEERIQAYFSAMGTSMENAERLAALDERFFGGSNEGEEELSEDEIKTGWLYACLCIVPFYYGSIPMKEFVKLINSQEKMSENEMEERIRRFNPDDCPCVLEDGNLIAKSFYKDGSILAVLKQQGDKPFYLPSGDEVIELAANGYPVSQPDCLRLYSFMKEEFNLEDEKARAMTGAIWYALSLSSSMQEIAQLMDQWKLECSSQEQVKRFASIVTALNNHTRMLIHRGFTPDEIAAAARKKAAGNSGIGKVYPNDPCPCGSGKKYKYCHGRIKNKH